MDSLLRRAARFWGIQPDYMDAGGELVRLSEKTLYALLELVSGEKVEDKFSLQRLVKSSKLRKLSQGLAPVVSIPANQNFHLSLYLPADTDLCSIELKIEREDGSALEVKDLQIEKQRTIEFEKLRYWKLRLSVPTPLEVGYHHLKLKTGWFQKECRLFSVPEVASKFRREREWGLFSPLHALRSESNWGIGSLSDLKQVRKIAKTWTASFVGVLPLLASDYTSERSDPSPYSALSRLAWNEIFLDVEKLLMEEDPSSQLAWNKEVTAELEILRGSDTVAYEEVYKVKSRILQFLALLFFANKKQEDPEYQTFLRHAPWIEAYAKFRAEGDKEKEYFHLYVQFQMDRELRNQKQQAHANELSGLYLDFPIGVGRESFDNLHFSSHFLLSAQAGAPPDLMFAGGQAWGFAPLHPEKAREEGYSYFIFSLRHHMKYASHLRFDHAMGFHRIYVIPQGFDAKSGGYLRYYREDFLSILKIESYRSQVKIIGEDLGTVPSVVRDALGESGCYRMWVLPFEAGLNPRRAVQQAPEKSLACFNTHDMIPFEGFLKQRDIDIFKELGIMDETQIQEERKGRSLCVQAWKKDFRCRQEEQLYELILSSLAKAKPALLLINLEDLWKETEPQNVPGTWKEYPNWRRKFRYGLEQWSKDKKILSLLDLINKQRNAL